MRLLKGLVLLMVFSAPAYAEHHRQHALGFLADIEQRAQIILAHAQNFAAAVPAGTHPQQLTYENGEIGGLFPANISGIVDRVIRAQNALNGYFDPLCHQLPAPSNENVLDCARRLINQPNQAVGVRSALQFVHGAQYGITVFTQWDDYEGQWPSDDNLSIMNGQLAEIWGDLDEALWHINDAIREEIYLDEDFF